MVPIHLADPIALGVDPAQQTVLPGGPVPEYIHRDADQDLDRTLTAAFDGSGEWLVVVVGDSKVGKSRTLYEGLSRTSVDSGAVVVVAPRNSEDIRPLSAPGHDTARHRQRTVLWLDDLEHFTDKGVDYEALQDWQSAEPHRIVAGTYGGKGSDVVAKYGRRDLSAPAGLVLARSARVDMLSTQSSELTPLQHRIAESELRAIRKHGLAAYLVAAREVTSKLVSTRHDEGEHRCPEGAAVTYAVIDWARCGRTDPISHQTLLEIWPSYAANFGPADQQTLETGLEWALRSVAGNIALISQSSEGYQANSYLVARPNGHMFAFPPEELWTIAIETASSEEAFGVGVAASAQLRLEDARRAFSMAAESPIASIACPAFMNLAELYSAAIRFADELAVYERVINMYATTPGAARYVAEARLGRGLRFAQQGATEAAIEDYDTVVNAHLESEDSTLGPVVIKATLQKAEGLQTLERYEEAVACYQLVLNRNWVTDDSGIASSRTTALVELGTAFAKLERWQESLDVSRDAILHLDGDRDLREHMAQSCLHAGNALIGLGRYEDAIQALDDIAQRSSVDHQQMSDRLVAQVAVAKGRALTKLGRFHEALDTFRSTIEEFADATDINVRIQAARAMSNMAAALGGLQRFDDALDLCSDVIAKYNHDPHPDMRNAVSSATLSRGESLRCLGRSHDALLANNELVDKTSEYGNEQNGVISIALCNSVSCLYDLGRLSDAIDICRQIESQFLDCNVPTVRGQVARATFLRGYCLEQLNIYGPALDTYQVVVDRYENDYVTGCREFVIEALARTGRTLRAVRRLDAAAIALDKAVRKYNADPHPELDKPYANVLTAQILILSELGQMAKAQKAADEVIDRFGDDARFNETVARAMNHRTLYVDNISMDDRINRFSVIADYYRGDPNRLLREPVAQAMINMAAGLRFLGRYPELQQVCNQVIQDYGDDPSPTFSRLVARAQLFLGVISEETNLPYAIATYKQVIDQYSTDKGNGIIPVRIDAMILLANALDRSHNYDEAMILNRHFLQTYGRRDDVGPNIGMAILARGDALDEAGELDRAAESYQLLAELDRRNYPSIAAQISSALLRRSELLTRSLKSASSFAIVLEQFGDLTDDNLREQVGDSVIAASIWLSEHRRINDATALLREFIVRCGDNARDENLVTDAERLLLRLENPVGRTRPPFAD